MTLLYNSTQLLPSAAITAESKFNPTSSRPPFSPSLGSRVYFHAPCPDDEKEELKNIGRRRKALGEKPGKSSRPPLQSGVMLDGLSRFVSSFFCRS